MQKTGYPCLLLFAELKFVPARPSDVGAKPSGTEETEQVTIVNSRQKNQPTVAAQTRLHPGSYFNRKTEIEEGASSIHSHVYIFLVLFLPVT